MIEKTHPINASTAWYQLPATEVMKLLGTERSGLSSGEARARLAKHGYNEISFKKRGALVRFLLQFNNPLVYVLLAAAAVTAFLEMWLDAGVIFLVEDPIKSVSLNFLVHLSEVKILKISKSPLGCRINV